MMGEVQRWAEPFGDVGPSVSGGSYQQRNPPAAAAGMVEAAIQARPPGGVRIRRSQLGQWLWRRADMWQRAGERRLAISPGWSGLMR
jgi:hypothetical protein